MVKKNTNILNYKPSLPLFVFINTIIVLNLCSKEESHGGWENDERILIFRWSITLNNNHVIRVTVQMCSFNVKMWILSATWKWIDKIVDSVCSLHFSEVLTDCQVRKQMKYMNKHSVLQHINTNTTHSSSIYFCSMFRDWVCVCVCSDCENLQWLQHGQV